jgi:hypothetical protein
MCPQTHPAQDVEYFDGMRVSDLPDEIVPWFLCNDAGIDEETDLREHLDSTGIPYKIIRYSMAS